MTCAGPKMSSIAAKQGVPCPLSFCTSGHFCTSNACTLHVQKKLHVQSALTVDNPMATIASLFSITPCTRDDSTVAQLVWLNGMKFHSSTGELCEKFHFMKLIKCTYLKNKSTQERNTCEGQCMYVKCTHVPLQITPA